MTTELEKTELEIAKLKLAQEKHKLEQMQKRQKVVDGLGQGAAAVSGVVGASALLTARVVKAITSVVLWTLAGGVAVYIYTAVRLLFGERFQCRTYPYGTFFERVGCILGASHDGLMLFTSIGAVVGTTVGIYTVLKRSPSSTSGG